MAKRAVIRVSRELVEQMIRLPEGVCIRQFVIEPEYDAITLCVEGEGLPDDCEMAIDGSKAKTLLPMLEQITYTQFAGWRG